MSSAFKEELDEKPAEKPLGLHEIQSQGRPLHFARIDEIEANVDSIRNQLPELPAAYRVPDGERPVIDANFFVERLGRSLRIEVARPADFAAIRAFMRNETIRQAPMAQTIQLSRAEIERKAARLQPAFFDDELTLLALDDRKICGILINKHVRIDRRTDVHGDPNKTDFAAEIKAQGGGSFRLGVQWAFLRWIDSLVSQHLPANCSDLFVLDFLGVHPDYRGCRLGAKLWNESMRLAKRRGFRYVQCVCSAQASLRIATRSGMSTVFAWPWAAMHCGERALFPDSRMYDGGEHANLMVGDLHHIELP
ncbi:hypothetical protein M3Y99_00222100 [Aphelenchoides fujianensis]|nr:hypothetical protein M3Y99_00222100 [Aphelenchoides fujianensis]